MADDVRRVHPRAGRNPVHPGLSWGQHLIGAGAVVSVCIILSIGVWWWIVR